MGADRVIHLPISSLKHKHFLQNGNFVFLGSDVLLKVMPVILNTASHFSCSWGGWGSEDQNSHLVLHSIKHVKLEFVFNTRTHTHHTQRAILASKTQVQICKA